MTLTVGIPIDTTLTGFPLLITDSNGNETTTLLSSNNVSAGAMGGLTAEINNIINLGYKLIDVFPGVSQFHNGSGSSAGDFQTNPNSILEAYVISSLLQVHLKPGTVFFFAVPWTSSGLEEVAVNTTTLKSFIISPNPANTFVDISLDYSLKGESEVIFISEAGYVSHKQSIGNISKNEKYNIDISKIPAGKYLVSIVNGKTYTTPQKLIVF